MWGHRLQGPLVFIGDIHGRFEGITRLWKNVKSRVGEKAFERLNIVFLGDYCDRGPDTKEVVEWLTKLPERYPQQKQFFLCGNHDMALSAFLGLHPFAGHDLSSTAQNYTPKTFELKEKEKLYDGSGASTMHLQGLRWASSSVANTVMSPYDSEATFTAYGATYGDRKGLLGSMPQHHKQFFSKLDWVVELQTPLGNIIAVHAGFEEKDVLSQIQKLKDKWVWSPWLEPLSGRQNVEQIPSFLREPILQRPGSQPAPQFLISGHHGFLRVNGRRIIVDSQYDDELVSVLINTQPPTTSSRKNENFRRYGPLHLEVITS